MYYYKCVRNGRVVGTTEAATPVFIAGLIEITKKEYEDLSGIIITPPQPTAAERREQAYNTEALIPWQGEDITVTAAAGKWEYYAAEGDMATADTLTVLIAAAKDEIRGRYPEEAET